MNIRCRVVTYLNIVYLCMYEAVSHGSKPDRALVTEVLAGHSRH